MDKKKSINRDEAYWERMRQGYQKKNDLLIAADWEWTFPYDFVRTIFPKGSLQERGVMTSWEKGEDEGGGIPNAIAVQITHRKRVKRTASGKTVEIPIIKRHTLTDDLDGVEEIMRDSLEKNEFVYLAPVSYFGKARTAANARFLHAITIDLDGVGPEQMANILKQIRNQDKPDTVLWTTLPRPTFIVNSGTGIHLCFVLDQPVPLIPRNIPFLQDLKEKLTDYVWRDTTSFLEEKQFQGIYQAFRLPGTPTKLNGARPDSKRTNKYEAVAFAWPTEDGMPQRVSLDYLIKYAAFKGTNYQEMYEKAKTAGQTPIKEAKKKWPEWYERRVVEGRPAGRWKNDRALYDWWLRQIEAKATDHHRYWCLNALAAFADKCGVPYDELEADALALVPRLDELTERPDNHFTPEDALAAVSAYGDGILHKLTRERIERRTAIVIPKTKRNGRDQAQHMEYLNGLRKMRRDVLGEDEYGNSGRPKRSGEKRDQIRAYAATHPEANHSEIARALGVSRPTVIKWLKPDPEPESTPTEQKTAKEKFADAYELAKAHAMAGEIEGGQASIESMLGLLTAGLYPAARAASDKLKNGKKLE